MSLIVIRCDRCGHEVKLSVRQPHEARRELEGRGWAHKNTWSRWGDRKQDHCPECR